MPELPEVETVKRGLAPSMEGAKIVELDLRRPDLRFPFPADLQAESRGQTIIALSRRAKYLLIDLENGKTLLCHLGMSGSFRVEEGDDPHMPGAFHHARSKDEKHDHVVFHLIKHEKRLRVIYNDPRRFGFMDLFERHKMDEHPSFKDLGPEPLGNGLRAQDLAKRFKTKKQPLKTVLLDQKTIAGLGNIYVCEALWRAHLSPLRPANTLVSATGRPQISLERLTDAIRLVIDEAIAAGGSSLRDHIQTDGSLGYFQHSFNVYDREGEPCRNPSCNGTISRVVQAGRSTFYCAACQM